MRKLLIIAFFIFLGSCIPYSDNPLTDPDKEKIDHSILGTWFWKDENESGYIHIGLEEKTKLLHVIMIDLDNDAEMDVSELSGHTSSLGGNKYLNLKWVRPADEVPGYIFVKYSVEGEKLGISLMSSEVVETAIKNGSLKGIAENGGWTSSPHITAEQKQLREFVLKNDKELFTEKSYLTKLILPEKKIPEPQKSGN